MSKNTAGKSFTKNQHSYAVAEVGVTRERSTFNRPSRTLTAIDAGYLYPIIVDEVLPGDTFQVNAGISGVLATPLRPFKDNLYLDTFYFFVPNRLVWENWQRFQGEKDNPDDATTYIVPQISVLGGNATGLNKLADYMGIPLNAETQDVNAMPFRAYNLIWNEFFRDQHLQDSLVLDKGDTNSTEADHLLKRRGKRKDYLTGCLPYPQVGTVEPGVISGTVPVTSTGDGMPTWSLNGNVRNLENDPADGTAVHWDGAYLASSYNAVWEDTKLEANLDTAQANTINQLRQSVAIQQLMELDARGGLRYKEQLKARFGVTTPDFRLQRPEYLGGGSQNISVTPVPGTNQKTAGDVGRLGGYGTVFGSGGGFTHSFTEHGYVIGLVSMRADYTYSEGLPRHWSRQTRYDYYEPALAHLGEQPVYNKEIFVSNDANDDLVFGYQERFSEYKYGNAMLTSIMRPGATASIPYWHLGEHFQTLPTLGDTFIQEDPPVDRAIVTTTEPHLILDCYFQNRTTRVMPVFNTPGLTRL